MRRWFYDFLLGSYYQKLLTVAFKSVAVFLWVIVYPERVLGGIEDSVNGDGIVWGKFVEADVWKFTDYPVADIFVHKRPGSRYSFKLGKCVLDSGVKFFTESFLLFVVIVNTILKVVKSGRGNFYCIRHQSTFKLFFTLSQSSK